MKTTTKRTILWLLVILWMAVIFGFSAQQGIQSSSLSEKVIKAVLITLDSRFAELPTARQNDIVHSYQVIARKSAHFLAYTILGVLCSCALLQYEMKNKTRLLIAFAVCVAYAFSDELHQLFVQGRSAQLTDVGIDSLGAGLGILCVSLIRSVRSKRRAGKQSAARA